MFSIVSVLVCIPTGGMFLKRDLNGAGFSFSTVKLQSPCNTEQTFKYALSILLTSLFSTFLQRSHRPVQLILVATRHMAIMSLTLICSKVRCDVSVAFMPDLKDLVWEKKKKECRMSHE